MKGKEKAQDSPRKIATLGFTAMTEIWRREEEVRDIQTQSVLWYSEAIQWIHLNLSVHIISWMTPVFQTDYIPPLKGDWHRLHAHEYSIMTIFWIWYGSCKQQILFEYSKLQAQLQLKHFHCWVIRYNKGFGAIFDMCTVHTIQNINFYRILWHNFCLFMVTSLC